MSVIHVVVTLVIVTFVTIATGAIESAHCRKAGTAKLRLSDVHCIARFESFIFCRVFKTICVAWSMRSFSVLIYIFRDNNFIDRVKRVEQSLESADAEVRHMASKAHQISKGTKTIRSTRYYAPTTVYAIFLRACKYDMPID